MRVRARSVGGVWEPAQRLGGNDVFRPTLALAGDGTAVLAWRQSRRAGMNESQIAVSRRPAGGAFAAAVVIAGVARNPAEPVVAVNDRGDAAVVWIQSRLARGTDTNFSTHGVFRSVGGAFGSPARLSRIEAPRPRSR